MQNSLSPVVGAALTLVWCGVSILVYYVESVHPKRLAGLDEILVLTGVVLVVASVWTAAKQYKNGSRQ